jgi:hypothetical protein
MNREYCDIDGTGRAANVEETVKDIDGEARVRITAKSLHGITESVAQALKVMKNTTLTD